MAKKTIVETDVKPDYSKYLYYCCIDKKTGTLSIIQVDRKVRGK